MKPASPYLDAREAAVYLHYVDAQGEPKMNAFYQFLDRRRRAGRTVKTHRLGTQLRFRQCDLDAAFDVEEAPLRRLVRRSA